MSGCTTQIDKTSIGQQNNTMPIREIITIHLRLDIHTFNTRIMFQSIYLDLIIKVTDIANDSLILHFLHVVNTDNIDISCGSHKNITFRTSLFHSYDFKTFHGGL